MAKRVVPSRTVSGDDVLAAVDEDDLCLNHRRLGAGEEGDKPGVVVVGDVASARIACGFAGEKGVRSSAEKTAYGFGVDGPRRNAVDAHTKWREFGREITGQRFGKSLASANGPISRHDLAAAAAGKKDDAAAPL